MRETETPCPHGGNGANGPGPSRPDDQNAGADRENPPRDFGAPAGDPIGPGHDRSIPEASVRHQTIFAIGSSVAAKALEFGPLRPNVTGGGRDRRRPPPR